MAMKADRKREEILRVAEKVFAEKGYEGATLREIADGVKIKTPALYYHFRSKEELYNSLMMDIYRKLQNEVLGPITEKKTDDPKEKIRLFTGLLFDFWGNHKRFPMIIAQEVTWGGDMVYSELVPNFLVPMFNEMVDTLDETEMEKYGIRKFDMPMLVFNVFGMSLFYFIAAPIFTILTGEESLSPERIAQLKEEIINLVFQGIELS
jgi:AcrR family transcriptional regulator